MSEGVVEVEVQTNSYCNRLTTKGHCGFTTRTPWKVWEYLYDSWSVHEANALRIFTVVMLRFGVHLAANLICPIGL
jgi:hypothetical protein